MSKAQKGWKRGFWVLENEGIVYLFDGKEKPGPKGPVAAKKPTKKDVELGNHWWSSDAPADRFFGHISTDLCSLLVQQLDHEGSNVLFVHLFVDLQSEVPIAVVSE